MLVHEEEKLELNGEVQLQHLRDLFTPPRRNGNHLFSTLSLLGSGPCEIKNFTCPIANRLHPRHTPPLLGTRGRCELKSQRQPHSAIAMTIPLQPQKWNKAFPPTADPQQERERLSSSSAPTAQQSQRPGCNAKLTWSS